MTLLQPVVHTAGLQVRWERLDDNHIETGVWDRDLGMQPAALRHVPNYGHFHRLVIAPSALSWEVDVVYREGDVVVRFVTGHLQVERGAADPEVTTSQGEISLNMRQEQADVDGRFIDIVAPGDSAATAQLQAYAILGLVALCMGDNAVGSVISSEPYHVVSAIEQQGVTAVHVEAKIPRLAKGPEVDRIDQLLPRLLTPSNTTRALILALRWFERGLRLAEPEDQLLAYFIAIEALVSTFGSEHGPTPEERARRQLWTPFFEQLKGKTSKENRTSALERVVSATLAESFRLYISHYKLSTELQKRFRNLREVRNGLIHGRLKEVTVDHAREAEEILILLLKTETGVTEKLPWESHPRIRTAEMHWTYDRPRRSP
jgi:hypothetical protein